MASPSRKVLQEPMMDSETEEYGWVVTGSIWEEGTGKGSGVNLKPFKYTYGTLGHGVAML